MTVADLEQAIRTDYALAGRTSTSRLDTAFGHFIVNEADLAAGIARAAEYRKNILREAPGQA